MREYLEAIAERSAGDRSQQMSGRRIAAVVPMHAYGHPVDLDRLVEVCGRFGLPLVEDAAESLGSLFRGRHTGTFGRWARSASTATRSSRRVAAAPF